VARHGKKTATPTPTATALVPTIVATEGETVASGAAKGATKAAPTLTYEEVGHYDTKPADPLAIEEALTKAQADEARRADVTRARELDAEVAARPVDAAIAQRATDLVDSVRRLRLPGMDHLAADAAECGRGACRIRIPSELVEPLKAQFGRSVGDLHLFAFDPRDDVGTAIVYVLPESKVSSLSPAEP